MGARVIAVQDSWFRCKKCTTLYFGGNGVNGKCAVGGPHSPTGSPSYFIQIAPSLTSNTQDNWRRCTKCETLFFGGNATRGLCPAGGSHQTGIESFAVDHNGPIPVEPSPAMLNWRWCRKCEAMFQQTAGIGLCPKGGLHDSSQSGNYLLHS
jgi:hypothetical protein